MAIQSDKEFPSLLFTPRLIEKERESSVRTRSPKSTRSPSTPAHGRSSGLKDRGRRSLTPYSGQRDTPPPPPFLSILDVDRGKPAQNRASEEPGTSLMELQVPPDPDAESSQETWVTVFGFSAHDQHVILREFAKCGNILRFGNGREDRVNWVHIQYSDPYQAQRALLKGGQVVAGRIMIGVKPLEKQFRSAADSLSGDSRGRLSAPNSKRVVLRPQRLDQAMSQTTLPTTSNSTWAKITEFVLGV